MFDWIFNWVFFGETFDVTGLGGRLQSDPICCCLWDLIRKCKLSSLLQKKTSIRNFPAWINKPLTFSSDKKRQIKEREDRLLNSCAHVMLSLHHQKQFHLLSLYLAGCLLTAAKMDPTKWAAFAALLEEERWQILNVSTWTVRLSVLVRKHAFRCKQTEASWWKRHDVEIQPISQQRARIRI